MPTIVPFETLAELPVNLANKFAGNNKAVFHRKTDPKSEYTPIYWDQVIEDVHSLASYMLSEGIEHGDRVGILSENRYEWAVVDLAIQMIGGINVSLYTTLPAGQCEYILQDSEAKMFFVSTGIQLKKAVEVYDNCEHLKTIIAFDNPKNKNMPKRNLFFFSKMY